MAQADTREDIAQAFRDAVSASSLAKVRIADLIDDLGINRNTFYYHFANKYEVAQWVFLNDLSAELKKKLPEPQLVYYEWQNKKEDPTFLAYYSHVETGARTLDAGIFFQSLSETLLQDVSFYKKLFNGQEPQFSQWITDLWLDAARKDVEFILGGRYMHEDAKDLLAWSLATAVTSTIYYTLNNPTKAACLQNKQVFPHWNMMTDAIFQTVQAHPTARGNAAPPDVFGWHPRK